MPTPIHRALLAAAAFALAIAGADCAKDEPTQPSPASNGSLTVTLSRGGANPRTLTVPRGSQITFVNNDSVPHQMYSDPHPEHTDCPEFDAVGQLSPGQSRQTTNLVTARTCNFHDHLDFANSSLRGSILIQ